MEKTAKYWKEKATKHNIMIVLENLWEPSPEFIKEILNRINRNNVKMCFDTGHANVHTKIPIHKWFS